MSERFGNPPLVELAAELRWGSGAMQMAQPGQPQVFAVPAGQFEEFFKSFASVVARVGYDRVERTIPVGYPSLPSQATYRFRKKEPEDGTTLYQVGGGVFTANITPPYHSWKQFRPVVMQGVQCLLEARDASERDHPFSALILRYIDAFNAQFTEGRSSARFMQEILGFNVQLPQAVTEEIMPGGEAKTMLQMAIPIKDGHQLTITLAEGIVAGGHAFIMDAGIQSENPIAASVDDVMLAFDSAHDVIHRVFVGITKRIAHIMLPIEGDA